MSYTEDLESLASRLEPGDAGNVRSAISEIQRLKNEVAELKATLSYNPPLD